MDNRREFRAKAHAPLLSPAALRALATFRPLDYYATSPVHALGANLKVARYVPLPASAIFILSFVAVALAPLAAYAGRFPLAALLVILYSALRTLAHTLPFSPVEVIFAHSVVAIAPVFLVLSLAATANELTNDWDVCFLVLAAHFSAFCRALAAHARKSAAPNVAVSPLVATVLSPYIPELVVAFALARYSDESPSPPATMTVSGIICIAGGLLHCHSARPRHSGVADVHHRSGTPLSSKKTDGDSILPLTNLPADPLSVELRDAAQSVGSFAAAPATDAAPTGDLHSLESKALDVSRPQSHSLDTRALLAPLVHSALTMMWLVLRVLRGHDETAPTIFLIGAGASQAQLSVRVILALLQGLPAAPAVVFKNFIWLQAVGAAGTAIGFFGDAGAWILPVVSFLSCATWTHLTIKTLSEIAMHLGGTVWRGAAPAVD
jgi:hypothetical protein